MADEATVKLELSRDEALVLFDFLQREVDRKNGEGIRPLVKHDGELWGLNGLNCVLERELTEPFRADYSNLVSEARDALIIRCGSWPEGS